MKIRRDLGALAEWPGPASAEAIAVARAIEVVMESLGNNLAEDHEFTWSLPILERSGDETRCDEIHFRVVRTDGR